MNLASHYNGALTSEQSLFHETRIVAEQCKPIGNIAEYIKRDNPFQYPTERQVSRFSRACCKRLAALENDKFKRAGLGSDCDAKEAANTAFNYLKAGGNQISSTISMTTKGYYQDMNGISMTKYLPLPSVIAIASCAPGKPMLSSLAVLGEISISGTILKAEELASVLQVCLGAGAKKVLIPITSAVELGTILADLIGAFSLIFCSTPQEAVYKALGAE